MQSVLFKHARGPSSHRGVPLMNTRFLEAFLGGVTWELSRAANRLNVPLAAVWSAIPRLRTSEFRQRPFDRDAREIRARQHT